MDDEVLRAAMDRLRVRVPASVADAAALRREVREADAAIGNALREAAARRQTAALDGRRRHV